MIINKRIKIYCTYLIHYLFLKCKVINNYLWQIIGTEIASPTKGGL